MQAPDAHSASSQQDHADLELLLGAAKQAGAIANDYFTGRKHNQVEFKNGDSPVGLADLEADTYLRQTLLQERPGYGWLSEETADDQPNRRINASRTFVVDPIDGTRAFIAGKETWCVSVAVVQNGSARAGVLHCPALGETFQAVRGDGAYLNSKRLEQLRPGRAIPMVAGYRKLVDALSVEVTGHMEHHRHIPSLAYKIALIASGRLGGCFIRPNAHDWDIAAAMLILQEAGGLAALISGEPLKLNDVKVSKPGMIAAHPDYLEPMLKVVRQSLIG